MGLTSSSAASAGVLQLWGLGLRGGSCQVLLCLWSWLPLSPELPGLLLAAPVPWLSSLNWFYEVQCPFFM